MHIQPKGKPNWMQPFIEPIKSCQCFATEFDLQDVDTALIIKQSYIPNKQTLADFIAPKKLKRLERIFLKSAGLPLGGLLHTKPLFITNMLTEQILTADNSIAMDSELFELAKSLGKECMGIETFAEQLIVLNKIPLDFQIKNLLKIGKNISQFRKSLKKMFTVYETGDLAKIHKMAKKSIGGIRKLMLYQRNQVMAERLYEKIQEKSIFCAIGAGHLGGKKGVLRLLKLQGLKVKPITKE